MPLKITKYSKLFITGLVIAIVLTIVTYMIDCGSGNCVPDFRPIYRFFIVVAFALYSIIILILKLISSRVHHPKLSRALLILVIGVIVIGIIWIVAINLFFPVEIITASSN